MSRVLIGVRLAPQGVEWPTLDATWELAGSLPVIDSLWMNDHLSDPGRERGGASMEPVTLAAALAHRVPGKVIGLAVLSNTFRHPAVLAKQATALDRITGGRFILGLGAGWHQGEHDAFGIPLPPIGERVARLESAVGVVRALGSAEAAIEPGVTLDDPYYPLRGALNLPPPITPGGPPIWLGGQRPRGLRLAARLADGWVLPVAEGVGVEAFHEVRETILRELEDAGRDPATFTFAGQVPTGRTAPERATALEVAGRFVAAGAGQIILGMPASLGPAGLAAVARDVAEPLRDAIG